MKPERSDLLRDVLDAGQQRDAVLLAGGKILRRKRHLRIATHSLAIAGVVALAIISLHPRHPSHPTPVIAQAPASKVQYITDDELLALFPDTPVALGTVNGKKTLIFPRPGDEARFIARCPPVNRL
jgi:hypothetical protein